MRVTLELFHHRAVACGGHTRGEVSHVPSPVPPRRPRGRPPRGVGRRAGVGRNRSASSTPRPRCRATSAASRGPTSSVPPTSPPSRRACRGGTTTTTSPNQAIPANSGMEFVPMVWTDDPYRLDGLRDYLAAGNRPRQVLVNNEPNLRGQSFITPPAVRRPAAKGPCRCRPLRRARQRAADGPWLRPRRQHHRLRSRPESDRHLHLHGALRRRGPLLRERRRRGPGRARRHPLLRRHRRAALLRRRGPDAVRRADPGHGVRLVERADRRRGPRVPHQGRRPARIHPRRGPILVVQGARRLRQDQPARGAARRAQRVGRGLREHARARTPICSTAPTAASRPSGM